MASIGRPYPLQAPSSQVGHRGFTDGARARRNRRWRRSVRAPAGYNHPNESERRRTAMTLPQITNRDEWLEARQRLLDREKELTRTRDALNVDRRNLPMV